MTEEFVFGNEYFDRWLNQKSNEILGKVDREAISTEEMLVLSLKAQVNHFHHMDIEFREEFRKIDSRFEKMDQKVDKRFDKLHTLLMWGFGLFFSLQVALCAKFFLGS